MTKPGDLLLNPWVGVALIVLVVNDHVLKARFGGVVTGKLSDVAGVFVLPLLTLALVEVARYALRLRWRSDRRDVLIHVAVVGIGFAAVKTIPAVDRAYEYIVGLLRTIVSFSAEPVTPILVYPDATDLLVLPVLVGTYAVAISRAASPRRGTPAPATAACSDGDHTPSRSGLRDQDLRCPEHRRGTL